VSSPKEQHDARPGARVTGTAGGGRPARLGAAHTDGSSRESPTSDADAAPATAQPGAPEHGGPSAPRAADPDVSSSEEP
jgi:hypothetical protein